MGVWTACGMTLVPQAPMCWVGGGGSAHLAGRVPVPVSRSLCIAGQLNTLTLGSWRASRSSWLSPGFEGSLQGGAQGHAAIKLLAGWVADLGCNPERTHRMCCPGATAWV